MKRIIRILKILIIVLSVSCLGVASLHAENEQRGKNVFEVDLPNQEGVLSSRSDTDLERSEKEELRDDMIKPIRSLQRGLDMYDQSEMMDRGRE